MGVGECRPYSSPVASQLCCALFWGKALAGGLGLTHADAAPARHFGLLLHPSGCSPIRWTDIPRRVIGSD